MSTINRRQALALALTTAMPTAVFSQPGGAGFGKQERDALNLARAAASGSPGAADKLKRQANTGDRWAAMQYGWLAHTGQMPNRLGRDMELAMRAYNLSCKVVGENQELISLSGNQIAAYNAGLAYYAGQVEGKRDPFAAIKWFRAASGEEGGKLPFYPAYVYLAKIYENGEGVPVNLPEAARYWTAAAAQREPTALYTKGKMLIEGVGVGKNYFEGFTLLLRAADQWQIDAIYMLAQIYANGNFAHDRNDLEATKWIQIAASKDERYRKLADQMNAKLSPADQKKARAASVNWMRAHMKAPDPFDYNLPINAPPPRRGI